MTNPAGRPDRSEGGRPGGRLFFVSTYTSTSAPYRFEIERPGEREDDANFLFLLSEYERAFGAVFGEAIENLADSKSPVLREMTTRAAGERVRTQRVTAPSGQVVEVEPKLTPLPYRFNVENVSRFDLGAFARACDEAAEVLTDSKLDHLLSATGQIAEGFGNVSNAGGQRFGWGVLLIAFEPLEIDFSPNGEVILPRMVWEHDKRRFAEYPPMTEEYRTAFDELIARKKREFDDRRHRS